MALAAMAEPWHDQHDAVFDVQRFRSLAVILDDGERERLSVSDGLHRARIDLLGGSFLNGPVALKFVIADDACAPSQIMALARFRALRQRGAFGRWLNRPEPHARRWIDQLRTFDGVSAGASERELAIGLFPSRYDANDWQHGAGSLRSAVRRLISAAKRMVGGGYRELLR